MTPLLISNPVCNLDIFLIKSFIFFVVSLSIPAILAVKSGIEAKMSLFLAFPPFLICLPKYASNGNGIGDGLGDGLG
jgi:hypothetical protein